MTSLNPIEELSHEHRYILKVVEALRILGEKIESGERADIEALRGAARFLRDFADVCHHGKEEAVLFPAMERKGVPESGCPLGALRSEHVRGRKLVASFHDAIETYASGETASEQRLITTIEAICRLYPDHIWKEDEMVFPMAERLFSAADIGQLRSDFDTAEAQFGEDHDWYVTFADEIAESVVK